MQILFVCTGNTCRSPMAAATLGDLARREDLAVAVDSAGLAARDDDHATALAQETLRGRGIELAGHKAKPVREGLIEWADIVLAMTDKHKAELIERYPDKEQKIFTLGEYVGFATEVSDPLLDGTPEAYERCALTLAELLRQLVGQLCREDRS